MNSKISMIVIVGLAVGLSLLEQVAPDAIYYIFAYPAAVLASLFFGVAPIIENQQILIPLVRPISIVSSCSAYGFFCLLSALTAVQIFTKYPRLKATPALFMGVPLVYGITIFTNSLRIVCAYQVSEMTRVSFPHFQSALHMGVGVLFFFSVILSINYLFERMAYAGEK